MLFYKRKVGERDMACTHRFKAAAHPRAKTNMLMPLPHRSANLIAFLGTLPDWPKARRSV